MSRHPLVDDESSTGLEHAIGLAVHILQLRGVASGLDGVGGVESVVLERQLEEITLLHSAQVAHVLLLDVLVGTLDLILGNSHTVDLGVRHASDVSQRPADSTAHVEHAPEQTGKSSQTGIAHK